MRLYNNRDRKRICDLRRAGNSYNKISKVIGCSASTAYYIVNPDAYAKHLAYMSAAHSNSLPRRAR